MLDDSFTNRTDVFVRPHGLEVGADVGAGASWTLSNAEASEEGGMLRLSHAPAGTNSSGAVYGTLWFTEKKLPLDGTVVEFRYGAARPLPNFVVSEDGSWAASLGKLHVPRPCERTRHELVVSDANG